ncbi:MAG: acyl-CoA thioesterase [Chitinophagales bacterium]
MEIKFKRKRDSQLEMTQLMLPSHSNFSGKIHGGYILNLMDQIAFACASKHSEYYCVTASVNKVNFLNPIEVGELVTLKASINYTGNSSMVVGVRVESENIQTKTVKHSNSSYFTMVAKDKDGNKAVVPGIILESENDVRLFARSVRRKEQAKTRDKNFHSKHFVIEEHLEVLQTQNTKIEYLDNE